MVQSTADGSSVATHSQPPKTLEESYADAAHVQGLYLTAVRDQGNLTPRLSAGLLGLSAVALYHGLTSPSTDTLAALGTIGAGGYAYGRLVTSPARLDVYRAGAEALGCAMVAVEPLRVGQTRLGQAGDDASQQTLYGTLARVEAGRQSLQRLLDLHAGLLATTTKPVPERAATSRTVKRPAPACNIANNTPAERALALKAQCDRQPTVEVVVTTPRSEAGSVTLVAPAGLTAAQAAARRELGRAERSLGRAEGAFKALAAAGPLLWHKSVQIQIAVSAEVDKTVPDLAAVLRAAQALPETAFALTGFAGFSSKGAEGTMEGNATKARSATAADGQAERELLAASNELAQATRALDSMTRPLAGVTESATREQVNACAVRTSGVELKVSPSGDEIPVAIGGSAVFFVSGGTGAPTARVVVGPQAEVPMRVEGGQFRFEYRPPAAAQPRDAVVLRFSSGAAHHFVMLRVIEAEGAAPNPAPTVDPEAAVKAPGADTSRPKRP
jgi:hypothetical protein